MFILKIEKENKIMDIHKKISLSKIVNSNETSVEIIFEIVLRRKIELEILGWVKLFEDDNEKIKINSIRDRMYCICKNEWKNLLIELENCFL